MESQDSILNKLKKLKPETKVQFYGQSGRKTKGAEIDTWKTFYFQEVTKTAEGMKAILSTTKVPKVDKLSRSNRYVYSYNKIKPINPSGARPNAFTMINISDMKVG